jgi:pimeloyl-ACP methyl ester carboxylesterase
MRTATDKPPTRSPTADRELMLAGLDLRGRTERVCGTETAILEAGEGQPLILLHGGIECGAAYWAPVIAPLADRYRVLAPDVPGLGESEPVPSFDVASFGRWFGAFVEATCPQPPIVVAHSLLGGLAARFAASGADLERLVVYAAPGVARYRMPLRLMVVAGLFSLRPSERAEERFERFALFDLDRARRRAPEWFAAFAAYNLRQARRPSVKRAMNQVLAAGKARVDGAGLRRIGVPVSLLWGRHDRMVPLVVAERAAAGLGWPLHVVEDVAHVPHIEDPGAFLDGLGDATR